MRRWRWAILFAAIALVGFVVWREYRLPPGVEPMGPDDARIAELGFYTAMAGAFAGFFALLKEIIGLVREWRQR